MLTREWIKQFREQATTADIKLWCLTSTGEWRYIDNDEEIPKGRVQLQVGFSYFDFYNTNDGQRCLEIGLSDSPWRRGGG